MPEATLRTEEGIPGERGRKGISSSKCLRDRENALKYIFNKQGYNFVYLLALGTLGLGITELYDGSRRSNFLYFFSVRTVNGFCVGKTISSK